MPQSKGSTSWAPFSALSFIIDEIEVLLLLLLLPTFQLYFLPLPSTGRCFGRVGGIGFRHVCLNSFSLLLYFFCIWRLFNYLSQANECAALFVFYSATFATVFPDSPPPLPNENHFGATDQ